VFRLSEYDVMNAVMWSSEDWTRIGSQRDDVAGGALQVVRPVLWPGMRAKMQPTCFMSGFTIGALYATGFGANYEDHWMYNAVQVALRRIDAGLRIRGLEGTLIERLLPNTHVRLAHQDSAIVSALDEYCMQAPGTGADPRELVASKLKQRALNSSVRTLMDVPDIYDRPVALLGITWSSEGMLSGPICEEVQRVVISPSATSPALTPYPWFARFVVRGPLPHVCRCEHVHAEMRACR
jgi:hypothetical protein